VVVGKSINIVMESLRSILTNPYLKKSFRWILKDKYHLSDLQINDVLMDKVSLTYSQKEDLHRLLKGEPINYIIGWIDFLNCKIDLSFKPLIPRPETEYWVSKIIFKYKKFKPNSSLNILDLGCGSGCIGISILKNIDNTFVDFVDIESIFLQQTKKNLNLNNIKSSRYTLILSDLFYKLKDKQYDLILSNPPYIPFGLKNKDLKWEPSIALYSGKYGLGTINKIIKYSKVHLRKNGKVFIEFNGTLKQQGEVKKNLKKLNYHYNFYKDQYNSLRYFSFG